MRDKTGILVAGFGTGYLDSRKRTVEVLEREIAEAYPKVPVYRAWVSGRLRELVREREGVAVDGVGEALRRMQADGVARAVIQPTCMIAGLEYDRIQREVRNTEHIFYSIRVGKPLLWEEEDCRQAARCGMEDFPALGPLEALVWFGHGTSHEANAVYRKLDRAFLQQDTAGRVRLATMKAEPGFDEILGWLAGKRIRKVHLAPFMLSAGGHVCKEMAGEDRDSWQMRLVRAGYEVECHIRGLGENAGIRRMYLKHLGRVMWELSQGGHEGAGR